MIKRRWNSVGIVILYACLLFLVAANAPSEQLEARYLAGDLMYPGSIYENELEEYCTAWKKLSSALNELRGEEFAFYLADLNSDWELQLNADHRFYSASAIKGPYVISLIQKDSSVIEKSQRLIEAAITVSDNDSYKALRRTYGHPIFQEWLNMANAGTVQMEDNFAYVTAKEMGEMWNATYRFLQSNSEGAKYCKNIFENVMHSFLSDSLGDEKTVYSKAGWIAGTLYYAENDAGIIMDENHPYVMVILSTACGKTDKLGQLAKALDAMHTIAVHDPSPEKVK